jgi:hypothetical protein
MGEIYEVADEVGSSAMIYIPSFIDTGSGIQKLVEGDAQTHKPIIIFFRIIKAGKHIWYCI